MKIQFIPLTLLLLAFLTSCNQITIDRPDRFADQSKDIDLRIEPGASPITADEAVSVARLFDINQGRPQTKAETDISDVYSVADQEGKPLFYAVNRVDNNGFVIVSASRNYHPILAYSEKGRFDDGYRDTGVEVWVVQQENNINWLNNNITKEQSAFFKAAWDPYEAEKSIISMPDTKSGLIDVRDSLITAWEAQGYSWTSLSECPDGLPTSIYNSWCSSAQSNANSSYDYMENSIIFYKTVVNSHSSAYAPITSDWRQDYPYNEDLPLFYGNHYNAGCAVIALGQIMRFHGCPSIYDWNSMPDVCISYNSTVASFIHDLFNDFIASDLLLFGHSSAKPIGTIASILESDYDYDVSYDSHNQSTVLSSLINGNPVYMSGVTPNSIIGHAWVCDGFSQHIYIKTFSLMILSQVTPPLHYELLADYTGDAGSTVYCSMNWGQGNGHNGIYLENTYYSGNNFSGNRIDMVMDPIN